MGVRSKIPVAIIGSGNIGTDLMIKIMRTSKTLELTSSPVWSWFCVMKDDCLPPTGVKPSVRDEGDEAMDDGMRVKIEPCAKRVRVYLGGKIIVDSIRSKLVWEVPHYPAYYFPMAEVSMNSLLESDRTERSSTRGEARYFNVRGGNRLVANSAWHYPQSPILEIRGHVRFEWDRMDAWFEEEEEVFVHPHDPYKRIDLLHSSRHIEVSFDGVKLADTRQPTILYETGAPIRYYIPKPDVRMDLLEPTDNRTGCAYKGFARYWSLTVGEITCENIAWSYPTPIADCAKIAGLVAFYNEQVDLIVDNVPQERPST